MKKLYVLGLVLVTASIAGCTLKGPQVPTLSTGDVQEITGTTKNVVPVISGSDMEEFTGEIDSGTVPTLPGSEGITTDTGVTAEVKDLINTRKTQSGDESKLTEEDIGLMEQIIQKIQNIGK